MSFELAGLLPVPDRCHCCASDQIRFIKTKTGNTHWPYAWICDACEAFVTCHRETRNPVGYMAGRETRELRKAAHTAFDVLWKERLMSRNKAYLWLSAKLGVPHEQTHISWLTDKQLKAVVAICNDYYSECADKLAKRKEKKDARRHQRHKRENNTTRRKIIERKRKN